MSSAILDNVMEGSTAYLTISFYDTDQSLITPKTIDYYITDDSGTLIHSPTSVTPASTITITLTPSDNSLSSSSDRINVVTIIAYYSPTNRVVSEYRYNVKSLVGFPFPPSLVTELVGISESVSISIH